MKEWMEVDPETLYDHVYIKRRAFIANAIFKKLQKILNVQKINKPLTITQNYYIFYIKKICNTFVL